MWSWDLRYWVGLADSKEVVDLPDIVLGFTLDRRTDPLVSISWADGVGRDLPDDKEVRLIWFMSEQRGTDEVVVQGLDGLSRVDVSELHERGLVLRLNNNGLA